ncbi:UvrD-helicase domain-containing protein [Dactylosporangium sp. CA-152071]|uniref:UvrD-helicase domain-containing protein n=1 Tax=Dactylosporangium sp. CA-152071 TaxID=3239933 RepID=UPI003D91204C
MSLFSAPGRTSAPTTATFAAPGATITRGGPAPTGEQTAIVDAYFTGQHLVVEAGAGSGKTSTLRMVAQSRPTRRGVYVAYNKGIADEAAGKFPGTVDCRTAHSFAYRQVGQAYAHRLPSRGRGGEGGRRLPAAEVAKVLGLHGERLGERYVTAAALARMAGETVERFCNSADYEITSDHVPVTPGLEEQAGDLATAVVPAAVKLWSDIVNPRGSLYFTHDHYLKIWHLTGPRLHGDYVMLDEAQDANPVIAAIVAAQQDAQLIYVGDRAQSIYAWRGAVDAMADLNGLRLQLTKSFRFGPAVAAEANQWLDMLDADLRLTGHDPMASTLGYVEQPRAILCRTNGGAFAQVMDQLDAGRRVALVGDGKDVKRFAFAAISLMKGQGCDHPELMAFRTWRELLAYVGEESAGRDLKVMVDLCHRYGPSTLIDTVDRLSPQQRCDVVVSTAHKAKGLEWPSVRIGGDFAPPADGSKPERAELMLAYVAVTRAQEQLDRGSLNWPTTGRLAADGTWWSYDNPTRTQED